MGRRRLGAEEDPQGRRELGEVALTRALHRRSDDGNAVVEFTLVTFVVVFVFLVVVQLGVLLHTRTVLVAAAQEGARFGANADRGPVDAEERTRRAIGEALSAEVARDADVDPRLVSGPGGVQVMEVAVSARVPVVVYFLAPFDLQVRGHALEEQR